MSRRIEQAWPFLIGFCTTIGIHYLGMEHKVTIAKKLSIPVVNILAINVGFIGVALTILLTSQNLDVIKRLKTSMSFARLVGYHWSAVLLGFTASIVSLLVMAFCESVSTLCEIIFFHIWILFVIWAFAAFGRVIYLLRLLFEGKS